MKTQIAVLLLVLAVLLAACRLPGQAPAETEPTLPALTLPAAPPQNPTAPAKATAAPATRPAASATPTLPAAKVFLPAISGAQNTPAYPAPQAAASQTPAPSPTIAPTLPGDIARLPPYSPHTGSKLTYENWKQWPVLPVVSQRAREIYQRGLAQGSDPKRFSKIGDCQVIRQYFLGYLDDGDQAWRLGDYYAKVSGTLSNFKGSYTRVSQAVRTGFNVASVLAPLNADPKECKPGETPLECEFRIWNPSIAIISMETWTENRPTQAYEGYLRQIVDFVLSRNVVPILATKADNLEGDHSINRMVARVAYEYDLPLWNFWAAADPLPSHGLLEDGFHLTNGSSDMSKAENLQFAWNVRNLTALQALTTVWQAVAKK